MFVWIGARLTPDEVQAERAALDAAEATPRPRLADMFAAEDQAGLPPGLPSTQTLAVLCGVGVITLHKHRKQNTCGIEDARVQLRRKGHPTRTVFDAVKASAFIEFMIGEGSASGWSWIRWSWNCPSIRALEILHPTTANPTCLNRRTDIAQLEFVSVRSGGAFQQTDNRTRFLFGPPNWDPVRFLAVLHLATGFQREDQPERTALDRLAGKEHTAGFLAELAGRYGESVVHPSDLLHPE